MFTLMLCHCKMLVVPRMLVVQRRVSINLQKVSGTFENILNHVTLVLVILKCLQVETKSIQEFNLKKNQPLTKKFANCYQDH